MLISNQCIRYRPPFYRATRMHSADYAVARCLSAHLSVCPVTVDGEYETAAKL